MKYINGVKEEQKYLKVISVSNTELLLQNENGQNFHFHTDIFKKVVLDKQGKGPVYRPDMDSEENRSKFIYAKEATTYDNLLLDGSISNADVRDDNGWSGLHYITQIDRYNKDVDTDILLSYLLTCDPPTDVNGRGFRRTPMLQAAAHNNTSAVKVLIDFGGDRTIKYNSYWMTPLDITKKYGFQETTKLLTEYFPSEEEKLDSQLECKRKVDSKFKDRGHPRFKQVEIDLKFQSIDAVRNGDLDLLTQSLPYVDVRMTISLAIIAIERDHIHLMGCLLEKLIHENVFEVRADKSVEPLLYIGLDPNFKEPKKIPPDIVEIINRSRVLSLFKILYHKYIYLSIDTIFDLVQTLMREGLESHKDSE